MRTILCFMLSSVLISTQSVSAGGNSFAAYYTRLDFEDQISGRYADIVVEFNEKQRFIFSRESSYLPRWETQKGKWTVQEVVPRKGDGTALRPDKYNKYSYVRIIENSPDQAVIHWRYIPDFDNLNFDGVVHEIYTLTPDKRVRREIIQGHEKLAVFKDRKNSAVQQLKLKSDGIAVLSHKPADPIERPTYDPIVGSPLIEKVIGEPAAWWRFDEGLKTSEDKTLEIVSGTDCEIGGNGALWKKGISGTALAFDGYFTKVVQPASHVPRLSRGITLEAWIVLGVYPYDWVAIAHQCDWENKGWFFGVDEYGHLALMLSIYDEWQEICSETQIPLNTWTHVTASFDPASGQASLYLDGVQTDAERFDKYPITPAERDLQIGLNTMKLPASGFPTIVGLEGLIDELKIYDEALSKDQIQASYQLTRPGSSLKRNPDLEPRCLPVAEGVEGFGAHYVPLKYHDLWDNMWRTTEWSDVVVTFDDLPTRVVFWRGPNYGPAFVTENNKWMIDQSVETGYDEYGCCEHMSDKQCRFAHLRIIESTPARAVVHWRYAYVSTMDYRFPDQFPPTNERWEPHKSWIDEYYTIYPDGVTVRKINNWADASIYWQDIQFLIPAGETPEDQMNLQALTLGDIQLWGGINFEKLELSWENGLPENTLSGANIELVNMKSEYKPFLIFPEGIYVHPWVAGRKGFYSKFVSWNHWPAAQIPSDGRGSRFPDRLSHSALAAADNAAFHGNVAMYGFTREPIDSLVTLTLSWNYPPPVKRVKGAKYIGYETEQRAYVLEADGNQVHFELVGSEVRSVHNPCFVIKHWDSEKAAKIQIKEEGRLLNPAVRQGIIWDTDGRQTLIVWIPVIGLMPLHVHLQ